ncbi:uncharacterized protein Z518_08026 [Rhinocladiella mackenziei CBS 650.93]|uniref:Uncharacterized protein n=1 Tax=Rhinocladiella mackenziei CBS 650.93 TaxID=1442369 RepID=A0A0D2FJH7_9EURO|nr:uncharacterized protein Z518_08026 [Rhinocladiella mackenziei CBS 650.93]KIX02087.1 hypothetical protein Z518_08026 [Rhinocladiella mackenziei CBS 650.93]
MTPPERGNLASSTPTKLQPPAMALQAPSTATTQVLAISATSKSCTGQKVKTPAASADSDTFDDPFLAEDIHDYADEDDKGPSKRTNPHLQSSVDRDDSENKVLDNSSKVNIDRGNGRTLKHKTGWNWKLEGNT